MPDTYPINIWINEERFEKLKVAELDKMTEDVLAGMKVIKIQCSEEHKNAILKAFPTAKFDTATTKSIELLPPEVKNRLFDLVIEKRSLDVAGDFLRSLRV